MLHIAQLREAEICIDKDVVKACRSWEIPRNKMKQLVICQKYESSLGLNKSQGKAPSMHQAKVGATYR